MSAIVAARPQRQGAVAWVDRIRVAVTRLPVLVLVLVVVGFGLRLGYGIVKFQSDLIALSEREFVARWEFDAAEHVLIAKALLSGRGYVVDDPPRPDGQHVRGVGQEALFKAPLYQFFLAGVFGLSGFSFLLFFPLQSLLGGLLSAVVGLIALETFHRPTAAWLAGLAAAAHPVLVNSASQPYNENLFFLFLVSSVWTFGRWMAARRLRWALACGTVGALAILTRESALPVFVVMLILGVVISWGKPGGLAGVVTMGLVASLLIVPWSVRNYLRVGAVIPVARIMGSGLMQGNNECVAQEGWLTPFWAEGPCPLLEEKGNALLSRLAPGQVVDQVVLDRVGWELARQFIIEHPLAYLKLCVRRLWTTLLPFNPRADQQLSQRAAFTLYWLVVVPAGVLGVALARGVAGAQSALLLAVIAVNFLAMIAVLITPDQRYRVGSDLLLGCYAGWLVVARPLRTSKSTGRRSDR